jgi:hypothetical protein
MPAPDTRQKLFKDSYAPLVVDVKYDRGPGTDVVDVFGFFVSLSLELKSEGVWSASLTLFDKNEEFLIGRFVPGDDFSRFVMRWAWDNDANGLFNAPYYAGRIIKVSPEYQDDGVSLTFDLVPFTAGDALIVRDALPRAFGYMRASEIVKAISKANHWDLLPEFIEDTVGRVGPFNLGAQSHFEFIMQTLLPLAHNDNQDAYVFYFDARGRIHFHGKSYPYAPNTPEDARERKPRRYYYGRDVAGEMFGFVEGTGNGVISTIDSKAGEGTEIKHTATKGVPKEDGNTETTAPPVVVGAEDGVPNTGAATKHTSFIHVTARTREEAYQRATQRFAKLRARAYKATAEVKGNHYIQPTALVDISYYDQRDRPHYLSGLFSVSTIAHTVDSGGWLMTMNVSRKGTPPSILSQMAEGQKITPPPSTDTEEEDTSP